MQDYQKWHEEFEEILRKDFSHLTMGSVSPGLLTLVQPQRKDKLVPLIVDETAIGDVEIITGSYPIQGPYEYGQF